MNNLFDEIGAFEIVVGRGSITAYEIDDLRVNDVVTVSDRETGDPVSVLFNSQLFAHGEILEIDGIFAVRIVKPVWNFERLPFGGHPDDLTEVLEFQIRLGSVKMRLRNLQGVGENSIISLGIRAQRENSLELTVAKTVVATGAVGRVEGHRFGIRIVEVKCRLGGPIAVFTSGSIVRDDVGPTDQHHVLIPDRFSKAQIKSIAEIHERFAANLNVIIGDMPGLRLQSVDQLRYAELLTSIAADVTCVIAVSARTMRGKEANREKTFVMQSEFAELKLDTGRVSDLNDRESRLDRASPLGSFLVFLGHGGELASRASDPAFLDDFFTSLRNGWKQRYRMPIIEGTTIEAERYKTMYVESEYFLVVEIVSDRENVVIAYPGINASKIMNATED